jgi:hypothetical protein
MQAMLEKVRKILEEVGRRNIRVTGCAVVVGTLILLFESTATGASMAGS